ncbi:terminase small subunit [Clostridium botulinum]|uniref:terminase small subunit n=1 Tax=Clostridium botulinum TaxID=1491 RepID=UPI001E5862F6|nr:terminase small subunit [Clostridium botulinum]MCD3254374.1 terminase small subunit [Clostridium botulinum C/D]MCD3279874.1 terminase small subunit [Clostridium botulinum C/D]MCD3339605.1 terminase small subunit [Clostridium botulinum C/D]MCD3357513.1 terminase small subunit [Clostridium botulinum C/D]
MASRVIGNKIQTNINDKQKQFCIEYLKELNGTKAYMTVYESDYNTARANASKLLATTSVKQYINNLIDSYTDNADITIGEIVKHIKEIATDEEATHNNKLKALELLARYKQMFIERKEITVNENKVDISEAEINKQLKELGYEVEEN